MKKNNVTFHLPKNGYKGAIKIRDFEITIDEPKNVGGTNKGPNPMENLMGSIASCIAITLRMYAEKKEWDTGDINVEIFQKENEHNQMEIHKVIRFEKKDQLSEKQIRKLYEISSKCPVSKVIQSPTAIVLDI